jgi:glycosyltransferase involved in cell wall biosynthesis
MGDSANHTHGYRITHVGKFYPPHMGGIEVHLRDLVQSQTQRHSVRVVVANELPRTVREQRDGAEILRVACLGKAWSMPICPTLPWHLRQVSGDVIHLHTPNPAAAFAYVVSGCRIPLVITHHSDTLGRAHVRWLSDPFVQKAMRRAARIIVTSKRYADTSAELAGHREKIEVVPLGIDAGRFDRGPDETGRQIRDRYGPGLVLGIGRMVPFKGFEVLVRAMQYVRGQLILLGDGPLRVRLEDVARSCGVADRVFFPGKIDNSEIGSYLSAADVLAMPSLTRAESFGIVQLEAMAAGVPVVNTNIESGTTEVSPNGLTGLTVPPGEVAPLADALNTLLADGELRRRMGRAAQERVRQEYTIEQMGARTLSVYAQVLGR